MKKAFALLLCAVLSLSMLSACGGSTQNTTEETAETEIRLDACGLAYTIPQKIVFMPLSAMIMHRMKTWKRSMTPHLPYPLTN